MREIKFRVWDTHTMKQIPNYKLDCFGILWWRFGNDEEKCCDPLRNIIMQYIGLKDKDGKEIYEGDIINEGGNTNGVVQYNSLLTCYQVTYGVEDTLALWDHSLKELIVIGNIYENPELLEPHKEEDKRGDE